MKRARIKYNGNIQSAIAEEGGLRLADGQLVAEDRVEWLTPLEPRTAFALGLNYADHARELEFKAPESPLIFLKGRNTFVGHRGLTPRPNGVTFMHYECELTVVIGREGKNIRPEQAYDYVAGYTIANDYAVRDYLENYYRPNFRVKSRDNTTPLGPWLVDLGDIPDPLNLNLRTYINGKLTQQGNTRDMIFDIPYLIAYLSEFMTLAPGDIILTGTPEGLADVQASDEVVCEIESIGRLINTIIKEE